LPAAAATRGAQADDHVLQDLQHDGGGSGPGDDIQENSAGIAADTCPDKVH